MPRHRRSPVPPPLPLPFATDDGEGPAGVALRTEMPEEVAAVLQRLVHEVRDWAGAHPAESLRTEPPEVGFLPDDLVAPVRRVFGLLREEPDSTDRSTIAFGLLLVCERLQNELGSMRSAVVLYQAALLLLPDNVPVAYNIGRLLRRLAMHDQAESWLLHAVEKAAWAEDWHHHALSLSGLGNLKRERGNFPAAVRFHRRALRSAREHGVRRLEGDALYDLAVMRFERGEVARGMHYAEEAIAAYGPGHGQLVRMANDFAWIWMHLHGEPRLALQVFQAIEPRVQDPPFRAVLLANIARAAAEAGEERVYELAWVEAYTYMRRQDLEDGHAAAFGQLALAGVAAMQVERAKQAAQMCLAIAERREEGRMVIMAEEILEATRDGMPTPEGMRALFPAFTLAERHADENARERSEDFAATLAHAVSARRDDAPESPVHALIRGT